MLDSDASTAKTLTLVAIILQVVFFVIGIFEVIALVVLFSFRPSVTTSTGTTVTSQVAPISGLAIISLVFSFALLIGIVQQKIISFAFGSRKNSEWTGRDFINVLIKSFESTMRMRTQGK